MTAKITVKMDNDAFADGNSGAELARILRHLADEFEYQVMEAGDGRGVNDINGNPVGQLKITR